eukprot:TRINITY_DN65021_c0_g1_i1.p1 TRINITY_DN65021_c0_g1~~TRINITY_DN65021_c0_g1_i1.p1  ORF type:complete len:430 (-),score=32.54 TRINITY_DN65021_c0_g1_i1:414-1703(-)
MPCLSGVSLSTYISAALAWAVRGKAVAVSDASRVGLCIAGPLTRLPSGITLETAREVSQWLQADVFAVLITRGLVKDLPELLKSGDWLTDYEFFNDGLGILSLRTDFARANSGNISESELLEAYASIGGNFLGPLVGSEGRNAFLLRDLKRCSGLIERHEAKQQRQYSYVAFSRIDNHWAALPPPLKVMQESDPLAMWIPDGQDWDGLNDRFAIMPRHLSAAYFDRWPRVLNGSLLAPMRRAGGALGAVRQLKFEGGPEWLLKASLRSAGVRVRRFSSTSALLCQPLSKRGKYGRCTSPFPPHGFSFKYSSEASEAHANLRRLYGLQWEWRYGANIAPRLSPPCFEEEKHRASCCNLSDGISGFCDCWTDIYNYERCCLEDRAGLWILPSAAQARSYLERHEAPVCWLLVTDISFCLDTEQLKQLAGML